VIVGVILAVIMRHRERMAMIEHGMHPDLDAEAERRAKLGTGSGLNAGAQGYHNPAQNQPGPSPLGRR
jgi:hypothetical protein